MDGRTGQILRSNERNNRMRSEVEQGISTILVLFVVLVGFGIMGNICITRRLLAGYYHTCFHCARN